MPPDVNDFDDEASWMSSCVPARLDEGMEQDQAVASCLQQWRDRNKQMPSPAPAEDREDWMARCQADGEMQSEHPDADDRRDACAMMWDERGKAARQQKRAVPSVARAFAVFDVKAINDDERTITGMASTPAVDRVGDIVDPMGAQFAIPVPLMLDHQHTSQVGHVEFLNPTKKGIPFRARIVKVDEPGEVKNLVDKAWHLVKYKLRAAVSIGFRPFADAVDYLDNGGLHFRSWEMLELSLVSIPANTEAVIWEAKSLDAVMPELKSIDADLRAALGREETGSPTGGGKSAPPDRPGASGKTVVTLNRKGKAMRIDTADQISAFEATRQAKAARMAELMKTASERGETLDEAETDEYDGLSREVKSIDEHLKRLNDLQDMSRSEAKPVSDVKSIKDGADARGGVVRVRGGADLPKGTRFARAVMALAAARGAPLEALEYAKRWDDQTPEVSAYIRATAWGQKAEPGTTFGPSGSPLAGWGSDLVYPQNLVTEFVDLLRPATVVGRITGFRMVPFNVRIPVQVGGSTVDWVGETAPKPVSELQFDAITLTFSKIAGIVVLSEELVRLSSPAAEQTVRQDMVAQVAQFMDQQFLDPNITETTVRPASITNGVVPITASGGDADAFYYDLNAALAAFDSTNLGTGNLWLVTTPALARGISTLRNNLGQFEFGAMSAGGGSIQGFNVLVSNSAPAGTITFIKADEVLLADDGQVTIDASNQATLDMTGGGTPTFSLWQRDLIAVRAERWVRWRKRRAEAVAVIGSAAYGPEAPASP